MNSFRLSKGDTGIFNKKVILRELREVDFNSLVVLYAAKTLLFLGIFLILLNNLNVIALGKYFGELSWVTIIVFSIGIAINFFFIPRLYFSSLENFKKENYFWDNETFWILPLFFFGTFFLYSARISSSGTLLALSVITIALVHVRFIFEAKKILNNVNVLQGHSVGTEQYFVTLKYLSAYYVLLLIFLVAFNPVQQVFVWIRLHT